jgi:hypothetical protein
VLSFVYNIDVNSVFGVVSKRARVD